MAEGMARRWPYNWYAPNNATASAPAVVPNLRQMGASGAPSAMPPPRARVATAAEQASAGMQAPAGQSSLMAGGEAAIDSQTFPVPWPYLVGEPLPTEPNLSRASRLPRSQ